MSPGDFMIKAILMDFNGVIIDDEPLQMKAYQAVLKEAGIDLTEEEYYSCLGMDDNAFVRNALARAGKESDDVTVQRMIDAKTSIWKDSIDGSIPLFAGAKNFIFKMKHEFALGIVSMARRSEIDHVLDETGLADSFMTIVSAEDISTSKPDPECYREGFNRIDEERTARGSNPIVHSNCLVIEDAPQGIEAGRGAGLKTLGVSNTVADAELRAAGADSVTGSLAGWMPDSIRRVFSKNL